MLYRMEWVRSMCREDTGFHSMLISLFLYSCTGPQELDIRNPKMHQEGRPKGLSRRLGNTHVHSVVRQLFYS